MRMIKYEEYVKRVNDRFYGYTNLYKFKFNFIKSNLYIYHQVVEMFIRYMGNDIYIIWDIKNDND